MSAITQATQGPQQTFGLLCERDNHTLWQPVIQSGERANPDWFRQRTPSFPRCRGGVSPAGAPRRRKW
ncbi:hypothetical protein, partial [Amycolatopsis sp. NPDC000740]|uniref:hypothetical protein n=1 Tax=Amycolatopsis sp. NPDC000740 TaxID=3154269 RepID=UPI003324F67E